MKYTTYLFDFDYTLADSSRGIVLCFQTVLRRHGYTGVADEAIKRTIGKTLEESFSILTGITDPARLASLRKEYGAEADVHMNVNTFLFPDALPTLQTLKCQGARLGIISTKYRFRIQSFLQDKAPADLLDIIVGGEDVSHPKPAPEGILYAIDRLKVSPNEVVYTGDSTVDAETARAAGVAFAGVTNGVTTAEELARYPHLKIMSTLAELTSETPLSRSTKSRTEKKRIGVFSTILLLLLLFFAIAELTTSHTYLFPVIMLLTLWRISLKKRLLPLGAIRFLARQLKPVIVYSRALHIRQIRGHRPPKDNPSITQCKNCGNTYTGNFCNRCGQSFNTPRLRFRYAVRNALGGLSNIDTGFGRTLVELLYRPGHMINDFISGKRVHYFRPFQTLFVLTAIYILTVELIDPAALINARENRENHGQEQLVAARDSLRLRLDTVQDAYQRKILSKTIDKLDKKLKKAPQTAQALDEIIAEGINDKDSTVKDVVSVRKEMTEHLKARIRSIPFLYKVCKLLESWSHGNKAVSIICTLPLFALATRWAFRKRKFAPHYNMTEQIFVQTYIACQILLLSILYLPFNGKAAVNDLYDIPTWCIFALFVWDYRQIFHCSWWQSVWQTLLMFFYSFLIILSGAMLIASLYIPTLYLLKEAGV